MNIDFKDDRIVVLDDHITPYRIPIFRELAKAVPGLMVLYCTRSLKQPLWELGGEWGFDHEVLPGITLDFTRRPFGDPRTILLNPTLFLRLIQLRPSIVVGYAFSVPAWTAFVYAKVFRARYVCWSTDTLHSERHLDALQRLSRNLIIKGSDAFLSASRAGAEKFAAYGVPVGQVRIVTQRTITDPRTNVLRAPDASGKQVILYVGALAERKGVDHLLYAFSEVALEHEQAEIVFVGDGPGRHRLEELVRSLGLAERVEFAGFIQPSHLPDFYRSASVFAFPSLQDTFGVALADAVACGLPVVASVFAGATHDYVREGANGMIVDPRDHEQLAAALNEILSDRAGRDAMGVESARIGREHSLDLAVSQFYAALQFAVRS